MEELFPVVVGSLLGGFLAGRRNWPWVWRGAAIVLLAAFATWASGEYRLSWMYMLVDMAEVIASAMIGFFAVRLGAHRRMIPLK